MSKTAAVSESVVVNGKLEGFESNRRVERLYGCTSSSADTSNSYVATYRLVSVLLQYLFCIIACSVIL